MMPNNLYQHTKQSWFWSTSPFYSIEGASLIGLFLLTAWKREQLIKNYPHWISNVSTSFFMQVISSFFHYVVDNRRMCFEERKSKREIAMYDAQAFEKEAFELKNHGEWITAAEKYELAARSYAIANEIAAYTSMKIITSAADAFLCAATCFLFAGKISYAKKLLGERFIKDHAHPSKMHAVSGVIALLSKEYDPAKRHFQQSLESDPNQDNIYLLYLFVSRESTLLLNSFNVSFMKNDVADRNIRLDEWMNFTLYYYAATLLDAKKYQPAIAVLEMLITLHKIPFPHVNMQCVYQILYEAYQALGEQGRCDTLFKITFSINKEQGVLDLQRTQSVPSMDKGALLDKATWYRKMAEVDSRHVVVPKGIFAPRPPAPQESENVRPVTAL